MDTSDQPERPVQSQARKRVKLNTVGLGKVGACCCCSHAAHLLPRSC